MINLRKQHPLQLVERLLFCQSIKEIGIEKILMLNKPQQVFLTEVIVDDKSTYEIDWEFIIFEATSFQMNSLLACFTQKPVVPEPKERIIIEEK